ncbi:M56 family metallopeptidase [Paraliomyxa miuraensis]|uniref:M56 family metallopeptidase n=1 Tax=Paraliomyxa miuraensis TaxID=376150 RepID=UPI00225B8609|nr:M56 family metallopeptidase [Paraliomyxa miuraensis]MCX4247763.1 M56 family metallopeptidase [Paraliomyxa miuraensis]
MEWLSTYVVHSTALIAAVWLVTSVIPRLSLGTKEALWKVALLGPLLTATVHQVAGVPSVFGELPMPQALRTEPAPSAPAAAPAAAPTEAPVIERRIVRHRTGELEITAIRQRQPEAMVAPVAATAAPTPLTLWPLVLLGLWIAGATFALGRLLWSARRLRKQLAGRRDVIEDPVLESFLDLCSKAGLRKRPRLTASPHLRSPIALGRREICLPERAVDSLNPQQQHGMLAHEMAHLLRHDPLWMVAAAVVEAVFFFQPLNHLARRKIQEVAEYQCDDWAARQSGTGVHLAKCLAEVAGWVEEGPPVGPAATVVAMADRSSPIVRRITRLLHERRKGGRVHPVGRVALTVGTLGLVIALVPGVTQAKGGEAPTTAPTPMLALASTSHEPRTVIFEDHSDGAHDRSRVRLHAGDEIVEIEVQAPRPLPAPPPPPEPPRERVEIMIHGHFGSVWPWGWGGGWLGMGMLDLGDLEVIVEGSDPFANPFAWSEDLERAHGRIERAQERAERARERAERARERALEHAERARERAERARARMHEDLEDELEDAVWHGLFGVAWDGEPPPGVEPDEGCTFGQGCVIEL